MNSFRLVFSIPFSVFENPKETVFLVFDILLEKHGTDELKNEPGCNDIFLKGSEGCYIYSNRHQRNQCKFIKMGVTWSYFLHDISSLAAAFCTHVITHMACHSENCYPCFLDHTYGLCFQV